MGCTTTSDYPSDEINEELIHTYESSLGFSHTLSTRIVAKIQSSSSSGRLNRLQFRDMMRTAGLYTEVLEDAEAPISKFFSLFGDGKRIEAKKLAMLGVLLGKGTMETKAELLFELYQAEKAIELPAVAKMVKDMCSIALKLLPAYASLEVDSLNDTGAVRKLCSYQVKMDIAYRFVVAKIRDNLEFGRKRLTLDELKRSKMLKFFHSPQEARQFAMELYKRIPSEMKSKRVNTLFSRHPSSDEETQVSLDIQDYTPRGFPVPSSI